jgi:hypothetical protein
MASGELINAPESDLQLTVNPQTFDLEPLKTLALSFFIFNIFYGEMRRRENVAR